MKQSPDRARPASADLAAQAARLQKLVHMARTQLLHDVPETVLPLSGTGARRQLYDPAALAQREAWAAGLSADSRTMVARHLAQARQLGPSRRVAAIPEGDFLDEIARDFPHFDAVTAHLRRAVHLARRAPEKLFVMSPILLAGPPGVGKTAYGEAVAKRLGMPFRQIDAASLSAGFALGGLDVGFTTGKPGLIWDALQNECMSLLVFIDEIDKAPAERSYPTLSSLYTLLEPVSAKAFRDDAIGLPLDASWISWIATANDVDRLDPQLRSRFTVFDIPRPTPNEMTDVIASVHRGLMASAPWAASFRADLPPDVVAVLQKMTPREAAQALPRAYAAAAEADRDHLLPSDVELRSPVARHFGFLQ